jgi:hypothetical protein
MPEGSHLTALPLKKPLALQMGFSDIEQVNSRLSHVFNVREHNQEERGKIESFIRECFAAAHNSQITNFMPRLLSLRSRHGELIAAFGLRAALEKQLFLETYLDQPIEQVLQARLGIGVRREEVIEVGNLSALYPGVARWLIVVITAMLHDEGYKWVVFTGTSTVRNGFHRLGLRPFELGEATPERLPLHERDNWGSYYKQGPTVMAGDIEHGYRSLLIQQDLADLLRGNILSVEKSCCA